MFDKPLVAEHLRRRLVPTSTILIRGGSIVTIIVGPGAGSGGGVVGGLSVVMASITKKIKVN